MKTSSELEAGKIILNAKEKGGIASRIKMSINATGALGQTSPGIKSPISKIHTNNGSNKENPFNSTIKNTQKNQHSENNEEIRGTQSETLGTKMFEYVEAHLVDEEISQGLYETRIGFSRTTETANKLQEKMEETSIEK